MITEEQYFQGKPHTAEQAEAARELLLRVNTMLLEEFAWNFPTDVDTGTPISGAKNGYGDGGFRVPTATTGRKNSSHMVLPADKPEGAGVDVFDPANWLDKKLTNQVLEKYDLYREHPDCTITWCHLTTRPPGSGKRTFYP